MLLPYGDFQFVNFLPQNKTKKSESCPSMGHNVLCRMTPYRRSAVPLRVAAYFDGDKETKNVFRVTQKTTGGHTLARFTIKHPFATIHSILEVLWTHYVQWKEQLCPRVLS